MLTASAITYHVKQHTLINRVSFEFCPGKIYVILGSNGSGKSTLLKLLGGLLPPSSGSVFLHQQNLAKQHRLWISQHISFIRPTLSLPYPFSVAEVVQMGQYCALPNQVKPVHTCLEEVHALYLGERVFNTLSDGEKQRVLIAQSLATNTNILLLDEPTSHLDIFHRAEIWACLNNLKQRGKTVIVATHDLAACEQYCDLGLLLHHGTCQATGDFGTISQHFPKLFSKSY
ncbi:MAG: heme ABC transporter ATP-binding protein [Parachlamydia sp.]|nr:MAG: heme ABC transporter ATP-binding protein [Parachlamydia sp.]